MTGEARLYDLRVSRALALVTLATEQRVMIGQPAAAGNQDGEGSRS